MIKFLAQILSYLPNCQDIFFFFSTIKGHKYWAKHQLEYFEYSIGTYYVKLNDIFFQIAALGIKLNPNIYRSIVSS